MPPIPMPNPNAAPSFEQVDQHVRSIDLGIFAEVLPGQGPPGEPGPAGENRSLTNPDEVLAKVKTFYGAARPVLQAFTALAILPPQWRGILTGFVGAMDAITAIS